MQRPIATLSNEPLDLLVIGGGIFGAGIARDATLRGLKTGLVEKADFASGTSSRSTKLIHGGFRYLEQWHFGLVAESCRERAILQQIAPHLVKKQTFLLPVYAHDPRPLWQIRIGMTLYDLLARNERSLRHRILSPAESISEEPSLSSSGLRGAVLYYDCQTDDARLCLETILDAASRGAACANYCDVVGMVRERDQVTCVWVRDLVSQSQFAVRAKAVVNAAGPWIERVARLGAEDADRVALSPSKGVHLVVPAVTRQHGVFFQSLHDNRMIFLVPWEGRTLLGTTDTNFPGDASSAYADANDVEYLLGKLHALMPDCGLKRADVITSFSGVRPLLRADRQSPSNRSREHRLVQHGRNFLSVAGGKYTTFRAVADQVVRKVFSLLGRKPPRCTTANSPLPQRTAKRDGSLVGPSSVYVDDIVQSCRNELAITVTDVMRRRTTLALGPHGGVQTAEPVSRIMAAELGWSEPVRLRHLQDYLDEWQRNRAWLNRS